MTDTISPSLHPHSRLRLRSSVVLHLLATEWRHHGLWALAFTALLLVRLWILVQPPAAGLNSNWYEPLWLQNVLVLGVMGLTMRVVMADAPASTDVGTHTRPAGRGQLLAAKVLFLVLTLLLPRLVADAWLWRGFGHGAGSLLALSAGSVLDGGVYLLLAAAVASVAASGTQLALWIFGVVCAYSGLSMGYFMLERALQSKRELLSDPEMLNGWKGVLTIHAALMVTLGLLLATWWVQAMTRRRAVAICLLALAVVALGTGLAGTGYRWRQNREPEFDQSGLTVKTGRLDATDAKTLAGAGSSSSSPLTQSFWPELHLAGLPPDHVATILRFAPQDVTERMISLGKTGLGSPLCWSDYLGGMGGMGGMMDMRQMLTTKYGATDLWFDSSSEGDRKPLGKVVGLQAAQRPWRLDLAILKMNMILDLPLAAFREGTPTVLLPNGRRIQFQPMMENDTHYQLPWIWRVQASSLQPAAATVYGQIIPDYTHLECVTVVHDPEARENTLLFNEGGPWVRRGTGFMDDDASVRELFINKPLDRMQLTGLKPDAWLQSTRLQFWIAEGRGCAHFKLSAEEMQRVVGK